MSDDVPNGADRPIYDLDDDEGYDASWAPVVDLIEDGEWVSDKELARRLSNGWLIPEIVRQIIADRIERRDARPRGQPKKAMSPTLVFAHIAFRHLRIQIRDARRGGAGASVSAKELGHERGTPKDLAPG